MGRPPRHGAAFALADPDAQHGAARTTTTETTRYGTATARAWDRLHPRLARRGTWAEHTCARRDLGPMSPDPGSGGGRRLSIPRPGPYYGSRVFYDDRAREDELRDWHHRRNWSDWRHGRTSTPPPYPEVWW